MNSWKSRPDLAGFEVVELPSIEERILLPWEDELSVPRLLQSVWYPGEWVYDRKPKVFRHSEGDWRIEIPDILQSEFGGSFSSWDRAWSWVWSLLREKELSNTMSILDL